MLVHLYLSFNAIGENGAGRLARVLGASDGSLMLPASWASLRPASWQGQASGPVGILLFVLFQRLFTRQTGKESSLCLSVVSQQSESLLAGTLLFLSQLSSLNKRHGLYFFAFLCALPPRWEPF